jgi:hypothetical protein
MDIRTGPVAAPSVCPKVVADRSYLPHGNVRPPPSSNPAALRPFPKVRGRG